MHDVVLTSHYPDMLLDEAYNLNQWSGEVGPVDTVISDTCWLGTPTLGVHYKRNITTP